MPQTYDIEWRPFREEAAGLFEFPFGGNCDPWNINLDVDPVRFRPDRNQVNVYGEAPKGCQGFCNEGSRKILARMFPVAHYKNDPGGQKRGA